MSRVERLLELITQIHARRRFTVQEMADEFGVSRRTMLRDLQALSVMGIPLAAVIMSILRSSLAFYTRLFLRLSREVMIASPVELIHLLCQEAQAVLDLDNSP